MAALLLVHRYGLVVGLLEDPLSSAAPQEHQQVFVHIHHQHHQITHNQGQSMHELSLLAVVFGPQLAETHPGEGHHQRVEHPEQDNVEGVEGVSVEGLSEWL
jgi:hypothetical protein